MENEIAEEIKGLLAELVDITKKESIQNKEMQKARRQIKRSRFFLKLVLIFCLLFAIFLVGYWLVKFKI